MATIYQTETGTWRGLIRGKGWPAITKTFRLKKDLLDWSQTTEDQIMRGIYLPRSGQESITLSQALDRYISEVSSTKKTNTQAGNKVQAKPHNMERINLTQRLD